MSQSAIDRYLTLLKKCVLEEPYLENEVRLVYLRYCVEGLDTFDASLPGDSAVRPDCGADGLDWRVLAEIVGRAHTRGSTGTTQAALQRAPAAHKMWPRDP